ncbi:hypothetical protein ORI89_10810 [Sphingobacterium sp. UT-1RO-CII-1]|uniref:hypothetical protein n=1 Tax=Sphingobacterium sp. UT-1RO-CII-1 TaxID=2995225 RepID=UPI00227C9E56|nr:hypothetical protein [Sphingobacterium sp. UT-1RO-CII-1]MCY4780144.1 hypothetical protein [Sphingobacterium sp. UT-1RO-CII-1]
MKKLFLPVLSAVVISITSVSCSDKKDPIGPDTEIPNEDGLVVKKGIIKSNETWTADKVYLLDGRVVVDEGVTLTIEPGTIIKAENGQGSNATALIVDRGAKLIANGTADKPIIFTAKLDGIKRGEKASTLKVTDAGQWGGVIMLGNAPISVANAEGIAYIEGIPAGQSYGEYGGKNPTDNSGSLKYVSIRFSGVALENNSEIQGLTLGGVGSGTTIENIEIFSNKDDGIEWFGGTVNVKNVLIYGQEDDGLDIDQGYSGTIDNALVIQTKESDSALEIDGPEGNAKGAFTLKNITIDMNNLPGKRIADFRDGATGMLENIYVKNIVDGNVVRMNDDKSIETLNSDELIFKNWELVLPEGKTVEQLFTVHKETQVKADATKFTNHAKGVKESALGADVKVFDWTFAKSLRVF